MPSRKQLDDEGDAHGRVGMCASEYSASLFAAPGRRSKYQLTFQCEWKLLFAVSISKGPAPITNRFENCGLSPLPLLLFSTQPGAAQSTCRPRLRRVKSHFYFEI